MVINNLVIKAAGKKECIYVKTLTDVFAKEK